MDNSKVEWIVLTKAPLPGLVKTRLIPELGAQGACDLYQQLLLRLYNTLISLMAKQPSQIALWIAGDAEHKAFRRWADCATFYQQAEAVDDKIHLGERMALAVKSSFSRGCIPVLIGVDVPALNEEYLLDVLLQLKNNDLIISPAEDGGYGLLGMKQFYAPLFEHKNWGSDCVFADTHADILQLNISAAILPTIWDVDEIADVNRFLNLSF